MWNSPLDVDGLDPNVLMLMPRVEGDILNVHHALMRFLHLPGRESITSARDLVKIIVNSCADVFDDTRISEEMRFFDSLNDQLRTS